MVAPTVSIPSSVPIRSSTWSASLVASSMVASSGMVTDTLTLGISISGMKIKPPSTLQIAVTTSNTAETMRITALYFKDQRAAFS